MEEPTTTAGRAGRGGVRRGRLEQQDTPGVLSVFRELNPNEMLARNTPKMYCAAKPGLLLSTVSTLETLGSGGSSSRSSRKKERERDSEFGVVE
ncbi:Os04g0162566 [Oryza sativa Japonica Group]|uniref:Os04g0162566 protein n=1 Tax=Oryza sativa subsp. japonica TaxID=39947 RepID=C7J175_ORYSJ|nr:Os04g0162566 [Oryza sativa Japonica Group]|eukprot:NP_001173756.1 Os04g0162566 [Oryza sativa Japonica Group]